MAKMHSRAVGTSGSKRPLKRTKPSWVRFGSKEVELLVAKLAKEGKSPSKIGLHLRDVYGIPDVRVITQKKICMILEEKGMRPKIPEDLHSLIKKSVTLQKHREENKKDNTSLRGLQLTESKIWRLVKYYKKVGRLPMDWKFDRQSIRLYAE